MQSYQLTLGSLRHLYGGSIIVEVDETRWIVVIMGGVRYRQLVHWLGLTKPWHRSLDILR